MAKKYIDAEKLKAEIKRQKHELELSIQSQGDYGQSCHIVAYDNILSLIDSLRQEQNFIQDTELTVFESALFTAFSYAWQSYLKGEEVNVIQWVKENSAELLEAARFQHEQLDFPTTDEEVEKFLATHPSLLN